MGIGALAFLRIPRIFVRPSRLTGVLTKETSIAEQYYDFDA